jgi:hypothetical protein
MTLNRLNASRGYDRMDNFSYAQKKTFITQRAMAASPLFMGGALTSSSRIVFDLITDADMLACNQNGVTGRLVTRISNLGEKIDVWITPHRKETNQGWIGIFNRNEYLDLVPLDKRQLGLESDVSYAMYDIWGKRVIEDADAFIFQIPGNDVLFIRVTEK